ncbi:MAG: hypothetical protein PHZ19_01545 [Candidatus Thermoplasmatota archaeon]|nr:hypothetical protein [Candidatus Thermoplasmatota archaeon]
MNIDIKLQYEKDSDFFLDKLPRYARQNGPYINTARCFNVLMGRPAGIYSQGYRRKINGVDISSLTYALGVLREQGLVERRGRGCWRWLGNGGTLK